MSVLPRAATRQNHGACTRTFSRGSSVCVESRALRVVHSGPSSSSNSITAVKSTTSTTLFVCSVTRRDERGRGDQLNSTPKRETVSKRVVRERLSVVRVASRDLFPSREAYRSGLPT